MQIKLTVSLKKDYKWNYQRNLVGIQINIDWVFLQKTIKKTSGE